jgi:signal peptide peptidase SppA
VKRRYMPTRAVALELAAWGLAFDIPDRGDDDAFELDAGGAVAVVDIRGPLVQHDGCFFDSYDAIKVRVAAALASGAKAVALRIDSPGGDALGVFELARELRAMAIAAKKPLVAYADGTIASAAYAIACAASQVFVPVAGFVGSIGVMVPMIDETARDKMLGLNVEMLASGARKLDGNPHVAITDDARAEIQARIDSLAGLFFDLVAEMRGLKPDAVRALEGAMFHGDAALKAGLADGVTTWSELLAMVARGAKPAAAPKAKAAETNMDREEMRAWLAKMAEGDGDDADKAKAAIKCLEDDGDSGNDNGEDKDKDKDKPKSEADEKAKAEADEKAKAKAEADEKAKAKAEEDDKAAKARSTGPDVFALAKEVHAMRAEKVAEKEKVERDALFAKRPDFDAKMRATLEGFPIEKVREAVETWPRVGGKPASPAAAASAVGTRGSTQTNEEVPVVDAEDADFIDRRMGLKASVGGVKSSGRSLELGFLTAEEANKRLGELTKKGAA